jgi:predicted transcriptional regulator
MTKRLVVSGPEKSMREVLDDMTQAGIEHVPVLDQGELLTIVHERDIMRSQIDAMQTDIHHLREYIDGLHHAAQD